MKKPGLVEFFLTPKSILMAAYGHRFTNPSIQLMKLIHTLNWQEISSLNPFISSSMVIPLVFMNMNV